MPSDPSSKNISALRPVLDLHSARGLNPSSIAEVVIIAYSSPDPDRVGMSSSISNPVVILVWTEKRAQGKERRKDSMMRGAMNFFWG
jgi:hypothetical protein